MHQHILIPTDGSETAQKGVDYGLNLAKDLGAKVTILTASDPYPLPGIAIGSGWIPSEQEIEEFHRTGEESARAILDRANTQAQALGVETALVHVAEARPAEAILQTAAQRGAQLIVIGSHGRRGINRLLLGSQAAEVLAYSTIPVLIVK